MYISKIHVKDYKSFRDSGEIEFKPGINLIVGQNNTGKTSLLEALEIKISDIPHRSVETPKDKIYSSENNSTVYASLTLIKKDMLTVDSYVATVKLGAFDYTLLSVPFPLAYKRLLQSNDSYISISADILESQSDKEKRIKEFRLAKDESIRKAEEFVRKLNIALEKGIILSFKYSNSNIKFSSFNYGLLNENFDTESEIIVLNLDKISSQFEYRSDYRTEQFADSGKSPGIFGWNEIERFREKIYRFNSERPNLGKCPVGFNKELKADASNLAEVLQNIKNDNPDVYEEFNKYVSEVIPSVKWVTSNKIEAPESGMGVNWNEVRVWSVDKKTRRSDLAFPLSASGTGVGQVLAILYVAIVSEEPRTIIIDEPNSFLHPGAAKKLIQILNKFPRHQYFISTHSPEILSAAKPSTITRLRYVGSETIAESINPEQTKDLRETLDEIGVKFSDVFFSENILWVEGETEQKAFPLILETADEFLDVAILPLVHTDDLRERKSKGRKHAKLVFEIYNRLSGANALTPPFVAVILDKESSTPQELRDLTKAFGDKLKFIPRIMYENYLVNAEAIANVLNDEIIENADKVSIEQVEEWIEEKRNAKFLSKSQSVGKVLKADEWLKNIHAADLLEKLFSELSNKKVEYRKTTHSVRLTQWLLENKPEQLSELKDFLIEVLSTENFS